MIKNPNFLKEKMETLNGKLGAMVLQLAIKLDKKFKVLYFYFLLGGVLHHAAERV